VILAVDIGNTNLVAGGFRKGRLRLVRRFETPRLQGLSELEEILREVGPEEVEGVVYGSVVPRLDRDFERAVRRVVGKGPLRVTRHLKTGLRIHLRRPDELGADRLVNAAWGFRKYGGPLLIVDFGTATTVCAVTASGAYIGGAILPGLALSARALTRNAAKLRPIRFDGPLPLSGRTTAEAMRLGVVEGHAGAITALLERVGRSFRKPARVVATGGLAGFMAPRIPRIDLVDPNLTLEGLYDLFVRNTPGGRSRA